MTETDSIVFVVDDDPSIVRSLDRLIRSIGLSVKTFPSARGFLKHPPCQTPSCLVLDIRMPGLSGLELQKKFIQMGYEIPIIFITGHGNVSISVQAMKKGAVDFIEKPFDDQSLIDAIQEAINRDRKSKQAQRVQNFLKKKVATLTPRENEVFPLVARGMLNKEIAFKLGTCEKTIKVHRGRVMKKMEAGTFAHLVRMAEKLKLFSRDI